MNYKIPFHNRGHKYSQDEIDTVVSVMQSAIPLTQGQYQKEFEELFT